MVHSPTEPELNRDATHHILDATCHILIVETWTDLQHHKERKWYRIIQLDHDDAYREIWCHGRTVPTVAHVCSNVDEYTDRFNTIKDWMRVKNIGWGRSSF